MTNKLREMNEIEFFNQKDGKEILLGIFNYIKENIQNEEKREKNLHQVNSFLHENLLDDNIRENIMSMILTKWEKNSSSPAFDKMQKQDIIRTGYTMICNVLKTKTLQYEKYELDKIFANDQDFFSECQTQIDALRKRIQENQNYFTDLKERSKNMTLSELAHEINGFHDPNMDTTISDEEFEDFFNGGTLEF